MLSSQLFLHCLGLHKHFRTFRHVQEGQVVLEGQRAGFVLPECVLEAPKEDVDAAEGPSPTNPRATREARGRGAGEQTPNQISKCLRGASTNDP